jgi:hypothetical protein
MMNICPVLTAREGLERKTVEVSHEKTKDCGSYAVFDSGKGNYSLLPTLV